MDQMPVGRMTVVRGVHAHRGDEDAICKLDIADGDGLEQIGNGFVLRVDVL
jgi:hypothetical protein